MLIFFSGVVAWSVICKAQRWFVLGLYILVITITTFLRQNHLLGIDGRRRGYEIPSPKSPKNGHVLLFMEKMKKPVDMREFPPFCIFLLRFHEIFQLVLYYFNGCRIFFPWTPVKPSILRLRLCHIWSLMEPHSWRVDEDGYKKWGYPKKIWEPSKWPYNLDDFPK